MIRAAVIALAAIAFTASAPAAQAKGCKPPSFGNGYYLTLSVTKVSCSTGSAVAKAFTKCRYEHGKKGRCTHKVKGYSCSEKRGQSIPTEFNSVATCKKGSKRVKFAYQQNT